MTHFYYHQFDSPLGRVTMQTSQQGLTGIWFTTHTTQPDELGTWAQEHPLLQEAQRQLTEYFTGQRHQFDLPFDLHGTDFQLAVWQGLQRIPYGQSWSYQQLATAIGRPKAVRAVGAANGKNPLSIVIPCHRVIGTTGKLTGYAGGLTRKKALLELEGIAFIES
ncbi:MULTISPECIES: methylated-DNA--[protein]-cysteine S-methyltransferase [unclassified Vibrio]|uniref:Methylated-DNA--protein-cysteine methyltransferase n=1 Tax=Vibrio sp. HB236076 TaxID=3232307 RepID=A0AB39HDH1_9VIBR|nr:methylated-DNA--[protein]-cysteine S-methyltransferase [Vibrio sp. HB161653]MDP5255164.1 methylated-DNA--[protein]-cysteine S-methyltransferase [Vibrio sp. HB161653]